MITFSHLDLMLAPKKPEAPFSAKGWLFCLKYDGYRCIATKEGKSVRLTTRQGKDATTWFPAVVRSLAGIGGSFIMDCEACAVDELGRPDFESMKPMRNGVLNGRMEALFCFDLPYRRSDLRKKPLTERLNRLRELLSNPMDSIVCVTHIEEAGKELFEKALEMGIEGVMAKQADSPYLAGRSPCWRKFKMANYHDGWKRTKSAPQKNA